jgi:hypothetical protein
VDIEKAKFLIGTVGVIALWTSCVLGCTAVEGMENPIYQSDRIAWTYGFISGVLALLSVALYFLRGRKGIWVTIAALLALAIHPAWTMSAWSGDCGTAKVEYACWFTIFLALLVICQAGLWILGRQTIKLKMPDGKKWKITSKFFISTARILRLGASINGASRAIYCSRAKFIRTKKTVKTNAEEHIRRLRSKTF